MGAWERAHWESTVESGAPRSALQSGPYYRYIPDSIDNLALVVRGDLSRRAAAVERSIRGLNGPGAEQLAGIARFLLRSEAIASSRIEGIAPSAQQVALAELGQSETVRGVSDQARLVATNMMIVRRSSGDLVQADTLTTEHIVDLHQSLLPDQPRHHGLRTVQNWVGGSDWNPIGADFVPPDPSRVSQLMTDLVDYLNGAAHAPLVQAALAHAQFETIHPFTDGNGRVGRALIHTVLTRRGLTERAVLPISLVLSTLRDRYVAGLASYRHDGSPGGREGNASVNAWLEIFVDAASAAMTQSEALIDRIEVLRSEWKQQLSVHRSSVGLRPAPRAGSAVSRLINLLPEAPVVTVTTLCRILKVSFPAASAALDELTQAGILQTKAIERGAKAYLARDVLDLITTSERALASTKFDTRASAPNRPVPAYPHG